MGITLLDVLVILLILIIIAALVVYFIYRAYVRKIQDSYIISQKQYCQTTPEPTYRGEVFIPSTLYYDHDLAISLIDICFATSLYNCSIYGRNIDIVTDHPPGLPEVTILSGIDPGDNQQRMIAIGYYNPNTQIGILAFGGTFTLGEWKDDFTYGQVVPTSLSGYNSNMLVHKGFYGLYTAVQDKVRQWINQRTFQCLFITGHSLGGALSEICDFDVINFASSTQAKVDRFVTYSFAAPRPGNIAFSDGINLSTPYLQRVANVEDAIPDLPPPIFDGLIYNHPNTLVSFNVNLGTIQDNHIAAYKNYLPQSACPEPC